MRIVVDVSYYQFNLTDAQWDLLAKVADGFIVRLCFGLNKDTYAPYAIKQCIRLGKPYAGYGWVDPTQPIIKQLDNFKSGVDIHKPASMFCDYEQYWTDWSAYMRGDLAAAYATRFTPEQINNYNLKFQNGLKNYALVGQYSADWFKKYCPQMWEWVNRGNYWKAKYFSYYDKIYYAGKKLLWGVPYDILRVRELADHAIGGIDEAIGRQFSSFLEVYGLYSGIHYHLDWNVFTDDGFVRMFGASTPPVPTPSGHGWRT